MPQSRLFIAVPTPRRVQQLYLTHRPRFEECHADVRWEPGEKLHTTLKFLGNTPDYLLPEIVSSCEKMGWQFNPIPLLYAGFGWFPRGARPKVIWIGIRDESGVLEEMHHLLDDWLAPLGFRPEQRGFHPHVTIGRVKGMRNIGSLLDTLESVTFESPPTFADSVCLMRSELKSGGSEYTTLHSFPLGTRQQEENHE